MRTREQALELVEAAFLQARRKTGSEARQMTLAVLNNRLLQMTDHRFRPQDFGAKDLRAFASLLHPDLRIVGEPNRPAVEWASGSDSAEAGPARPSAAPNNSSDTGPVQSTVGPSVPLQGEAGRVRKDLWMAIMDYSSGRPYIWDAVAGRARIAQVEDEGALRMPTLTVVELAEWRLSFVEANKGYLQGQALVSAQRWQEQGLPTTYLPFNLQQRWNKELTVRVKQRLQDFFSLWNHGVAIDAEEGTGTSRAEAERAALEAEVAAASDRGDLYSVGALLAQDLSDASPEAAEELLVKVTSAWASTRGVAADIQSLEDLAGRKETFTASNLATAFVNALGRLDDLEAALPDGVSDFAFRIRDEVRAIYDVERKSPVDMCRAAVATLDHAVAEVRSAIERFVRTTPATASTAAVEVLKYAHRLQPLVVPAERQFLRDLDILIGPSFRKLFSAYERSEAVEVLRRAPEFVESMRKQRPSPSDPRQRSQIWTELVKPIFEHLGALIEEATSRGEVAVAPVLALRNPRTKADLSSTNTDIALAFSLVNRGQGHANDISLRQTGKTNGADLVVIEPAGPFDVPPDGEQVVRLRLRLGASSTELDIPIEWSCQSNSGRIVASADCLHVSQQVTEPDWKALLNNPPYSLNPIRQAERLYGRASLLTKLRLAAMAGASHFVWGQKRIGKTSLLQVLAAELSQRDDVTCVLLRMGEVASLHEGQLAHLIAQRLVEKAQAAVQVPAEAEFGASLSRLIPFMEQLMASKGQHKYLVIIDEFDDLDAAFYTGERGKQFVKSLRSISEVGLTFFFVGSERMEAIYSRHQADLNKWRNIQLDRIDSRTDCRALIAEPVANVIEFSTEAVDFITDFTAGNPFYIHNFCYQVFERCLQEHRTFVDDNDTHAVRDQLLRALGPTNFSHLWEDNPVLELEEKRRDSAENCVTLACIAVLGGRYEAVEDLAEVQETLPIAVEDRAPAAVLRRACERLTRRGVLSVVGSGTARVISLPIFREWLGGSAVAKLLPQWSDYKEGLRRTQDQAGSGLEALEVPDQSAFPISEDDLLAITPRLVYCGKQKDVAEIRSWLRQFDDDSRIEMAFQLLRRVADKGFINEGAKTLALNVLEQMIQEKRRTTGEGKWQAIKERRDNLALGYFDSEHKSGGSTARELQKILRPGKLGPAIGLEAWMRAHLEADALLVIGDDFAGTGQTLAEGMAKFQAKIDPAIWKRFVDERRIAVYVMFAFPEAINRMREAFPGIDVVAATLLGDELRACDEGAGIFADEAERRFAEQVLQQIGRELSPRAPMGHGGLGALVVFHNAAPNNSLPILWCSGTVGERPWKALFQRA